eukprot:c23012_g3_i1 orf=324-1964(+)
MGCSSSKQFDKQLMSENLSAPLPRSISMPVYHRPDKQGDSYHMVALTSCSYDLWKLHRPDGNGISFANFRRCDQDTIDYPLDFSPPSKLDAKQILADVKTKEWVEDEVGEDREPETINTWELMEGIEDGRSPSPLNRPLSPLNNSESGNRMSLDRSLSFHTMGDVDSRSVMMGLPLDSVWRKYYKISKESASSQNKSPPVMPPIKQSFNSKSSSPSQSDLSSQNSLLNGGRRARSSFDGETERHSGATSGISRDSAPRSPLERTNPPSKSDWIPHSDCSFQGSSSPLFDPAIVATFQKALELESEDECRPSNDSILSHSSSDHTSSSSERISEADSPQSERASDLWSSREGILFESKVEGKGDGSCGRKLSFSKVSPVDYEEKEWKKGESLESFALICPPAGEGMIVLYFTSLRGVRKTYEDCCDVRLILQGMRLHVDERDVWMHSRFKEELTDLFDKGVTLPRLFIKGRYIGDAEEVKRLHEEGVLAKLLEGMPASRKVCDGCGDVRFIPCLTCSGSCKLITEDDDLKRCPDCNENGLIMCPICT